MSGESSDEQERFHHLLQHEVALTPPHLLKVWRRLLTLLSRHLLFFGTTVDEANELVHEVARNNPLTKPGQLARRQLKVWARIARDLPTPEAFKKDGSVIDEI